MSSLRRSYTGGPSESQKLYGSDLPPSLRWGAARKHAGSHRPEAVYQSDFRSNFPSTPKYGRRGRSRSRSSPDKLAADSAEERAELRLERRRLSRPRPRLRGRGRGDASSHTNESRGRSSDREEYHTSGPGRLEHRVTDGQGIERERRPYAVGGPTKDRAKRLLLRDTLEEVISDEQRDVEEELFLRRNLRSDTRLSVDAGAERSGYPLNERIKHRDYESKKKEPSLSPRPESPRSAIKVPRQSEDRRRRQSRRDRSRSKSSGDSHSTSVPRESKSWFSKSWSVRPQNEHNVQNTGTNQTSQLSTGIVTELADEPQPKLEAAPAVPSPFQRVRSWRYNQVLPTIETTLQRVVHATYGDLLQNEALKGPNPPGFIAVPQSCSSQGDTLYHILNLQQNQLDFEAFKNTVVNLPELRKVRDDVNAHFDRAQQLYEHQAHDRNATRSMNGFCHHTEASAGQARMTLIGLPFVQLKEHSHQTEAEFKSFAIINRLLCHSRGSQVDKDQAATHPDTTHATRTLFQYLNPRDNSRRDLKQVICHMLGSRDKRYLCVSQIWIFVANEELIITSSTLPESDLCGELLLPLTAQSAPPKRSLLNVHVVSGDGRQWILRAADCLTYIDFAANFSDITHQFAEDFVVYHDKEEIKSSDWSHKMQQASTTTLRLELRRMKPSEFAAREHCVWSYRSRNFKWKRVPEQRAPTERMLLVPRSFPLGVPGFVVREHFVRPFRRFVTKLRQYQNEQDRSPANTATESMKTDETQDNANSTVNDARGGRTSDAGWSDSEDARQSEDKTSASESDSEHAESDRHSINDKNERDQRSDMIYVLPKAAIKAKVLSGLGISFTEQAHDFAVAGGLDESQLFDVMRMKHKLNDLEGLRKMTCEYLLRTPTGDHDKPRSESDAPNPTVAETDGRASFRTSRRAAANVFNENTMYKTCPELTRAAFHDKLRTWMAAPLPDTSVHPDHVVGIPSPDSNSWGLLILFGWSFPRHINVGTGENMYIYPEGLAMFQCFLDGLWLTLKTSNCAKRPSELQTAEEKLLGAVSALVGSIHESMERAEEFPYFAFSCSVSRNFTRLFGVLNNLETHVLTIQTVYEIPDGWAAYAQAEYIVTLKHVTTALLLAAKTLSELEDQTEVLEAEKVRRNEALAKISSTADSSADYVHVEECCSKIFRTQREAHRQKRFQRSIDQLENLGWNKDAARTILLNECRRRRIVHHAETAVRMLETSFLDKLTSDASRKIRWKAVALPTDLVALLLTQVLERPVLNDQDALNMYMRYITDLESNILTGEPSREPLDRIRYLRHELNAFSQLQQEQIDVLGKVTSALLSSDETQDYHARDDPHPRRTVFATLPKGIQIQKDIIQSLSDMLDDLQSEARAQILGVQDWRDNAAVVFTIITVIFLPLSFVASVFGMNTADVRNMELTQWVFWTCAIVFTVIVVLITVYFVDVPPLWRWLERKGGGDGREQVVPQTAQRSRSHFFAGLARHSGGIADADEGIGLDAQRNETVKAEDLMASDAQDSSAISEEEN